MCLSFFFLVEQRSETRSDGVVDGVKASDDGKIMIDMIEAIHAAEKKQADADAYKYSEEKRKLKVCHPFACDVCAYTWSLFSAHPRFNCSMACLCGFTVLLLNCFSCRGHHSSLRTAAVLLY